MEKSTQQMTFFLLVTSQLLFLSVCGHSDFVIYNQRTANFDEAKRFCLDNGYAGLAVLDTPAKMQAVLKGDISRGRSYWVGLTQQDRSNPRQDTWAWETGTTWAAWKRGEPNYLATDHCARLWGDRRQIANKPCYQQYNFICERTYDRVTNPQVTDAKTGLNDLNKMVVWVGTAPTEQECRKICDQKPLCGFAVFVQANLSCTTMSSSALAQGSYTMDTDGPGSVRQRDVTQ